VGSRSQVDAEEQDQHECGWDHLVAEPGLNLMDGRHDAWICAAEERQHHRVGQWEAEPTTTAMM
jgi:hypothetical protein